MVAFTDGVTEARRGSEQYGDDRLHSLLADCIGLSADAIAAGIGDAVLRFQGEHAHDDTALDRRDERARLTGLLGAGPGPGSHRRGSCPVGARPRRRGLRQR